MSHTPDDPSEEERPGGPEGAEGEAPESLPVGSILAGRYRILSLLGKGAMGAVYLGEHLKIGRKDAIKVLRPSMARDREAIARFTRGARNASAIRHPNVCSIYDFGTTEEGLHFLAMEFVEGASLTDVLRNEGPLPPDRAADLLGQAAGALQVAHDRGIIHRDLKPDNMMLAREPDGTEVLKVVDFDIALGPPEGEGARVTRHGYVVGTPEYMSPEQLTGDPLDGRSDIYSLALVFFRMLTGHLPFEDGTAQEVMVRRLTEEPMSLSEAAPDLPGADGLDPLMRRALARRREDRPSSAAEFARQVREVVGEGTPGTVAAPSAPPSRGPSSPTPSSRADDVPSTEVAPAGGEGAGRASGRSSRLRMTALGGGAGLLLVGLAAGLFTVLGPGGPSEDPTPGSDGGAVEEERGSPSEDGSGEGGSGEEGGASPEEGDSDPGAGEGEDEGGAEGGGGAGEPEGDPGDSSGEPDPDPGEPGPDPGSSEVVLPGEAPSEILLRQLMAQSSEGPDAPPVLRAIRDTASAVWSRGDLTRSDSALAAYVLGSTLIPLGDSLRGVRWLEDAVRLDPRPGYVELLRLHKEGGR